MLTFLADIDIGAGSGGVLFGIICAVIAPGRGRSALAWFFIGLFTSCIGLVILLVLPDLSQQQDTDAKHRKEMRRLREQLKKERQVADSRHQVHADRLDAHDRALGMDTAEPLPPPEPEPELPPPPPPAEPSEPMWFFAAVDKQLGPVAESQLRALREGGTIDDDTLVWREGMDDWLPYRDCELG
ncbi:MAG: DUF4339 domain-containing protein [bacterium]|nr:DUF4339 domain-containing protein [bacterium]